MNDLALFCHTFGDQQVLTDELARTIGIVGFLISTSKTKLMNLNAGEGTLKLDGEDLGNVEELT